MILILLNSVHISSTDPFQLSKLHIIICWESIKVLINEKGSLQGDVIPVKTDEDPQPKIYIIVKQNLKIYKVKGINLFVEF